MMISFEEGYARIAALAQPLEIETISLENAAKRILRAPLVAKRPHPAADISAMDGYALSGSCKTYQQIGEISAGQEFSQPLKMGEAVRVFTGAIMPKGADRVLIQENAQAFDDQISAKPVPSAGRHIRKQGSDFPEGFVLEAPRRLSASDVALIGAMNYANIQTTRRPHIQILATGSELVNPGDAKKATDTIASNAYGIKAMAEYFGAKVDILPLVKDDPEAIQNAMKASNGDLLITTGGASVGKYDFVKDAAKQAGFDIALHKIALRPGKPIMAGSRDQQMFLGLPGNPVSSMICASLFMRAIILAQLGLSPKMPTLKRAKLATALTANGDRTHFMRALIRQSETGFEAQVFSNQDSAAISLLSQTNGLVVVAPNEPGREIGEEVQFMDLRNY